MNSSCRQHDQQHSAVKLQGHRAESFEAFSKLSLRLYRGLNAVPQAKAGRAPTSAGAVPFSGNTSSTHVAATTGLDSALPKTSAAADAGYRGTESLVGWGWFWQLAAFVKDQFSRMKPKLLGRPDVSTVPQVVPAQQGSSAKQSYQNSTHGRHLLAGTSSFGTCIRGRSCNVYTKTLNPKIAPWVSAPMCIVQASSYMPQVMLHSWVDCAGFMQKVLRQGYHAVFSL